MNASASQAEVLVIEDDGDVRDLITMLLQRQGLKVQACGSAIDGFNLLPKNRFDLIVLDWMLPGMSGIEFLNKISQMGLPKTQILMVTAKAEPQDIILGLDSGADDYINKPFEPAVFLARVKALLRRNQGSAVTHIIRIGQLELNLDSHECKCANELVHLTPSEFKIMSELLQSGGKVLTRDYLVSSVQGDGITVTGRTIDTHVFGLRKKMGPCADLIETIRGVGYRMITG